METDEEASLPLLLLEIRLRSCKGLRGLCFLFELAFTIAVVGVGGGGKYEVFFDENALLIVRSYIYQ